MGYRLAWEREDELYVSQGEGGWVIGQTGRGMTCYRQAWGKEDGL